MFGNRGVSLVIVMFVSTIVMLLGTALLNMSTSEYLMGSYGRDYTAAYYLAEGGIQKALALLKENPDYRGDSGWQSMGAGQYRIKISREYSNNLVRIESTGKVNKAEVLINLRADVQVEIDEEAEYDPPLVNIHIWVENWEYRGPN
ncbi:MAG: pilus assembly PilX N-terminal domain-containing protein [Tepidanaerobacteraceae bacterium]|jgi:type II secretory pathway component PulK|nr:hypothetical protein [Tepidanaerobacter sp.]